MVAKKFVEAKYIKAKEVIENAKDLTNNESKSIKVLKKIVKKIDEFRKELKAVDKVIAELREDNNKGKYDRALAKIVALPTSFTKFCEWQGAKEDLEKIDRSNFAKTPKPGAAFGIEKTTLRDTVTALTNDFSMLLKQLEAKQLSPKKEQVQSELDEMKQANQSLTSQLLMKKAEIQRLNLRVRSLEADNLKLQEKLNKASSVTRIN